MFLPPEYGILLGCYVLYSYVSRKGKVSARVQRKTLEPTFLIREKDRQWSNLNIEPIVRTVGFLFLGVEMKVVYSLILNIILAVGMAVAGWAQPVYGQAPSGQNEALFVPKQCVIEFEKDSPLVAVADLLFEQGQLFSTIVDGNDGDYLDRLNQRYRLKSLEMVFTVDEKARNKRWKQIDGKNKKVKQKGAAKISKSNAGLVAKYAIGDFEQGLKSKKNRKTKSKNSSVITKKSNIEYLGRFYRASFKKEVNCALYERSQHVKSSQRQPIFKLNAMDPYPPTDSLPPAEKFYSLSATNYPIDVLWNLTNIGLGRDKLNNASQPHPWEITQGEGVVIAVIDNGIDLDHEDLDSNIWVNEDEYSDNGIDDDGNGFVDDVYGWNFEDHNNDVTDNKPGFGHGHGTHIAGIIAAENNGVGIVGVAPKAKLMSIVRGDIAESIRYAADNGADIISASVACGFCPRNPLMESVLEYAHSEKDVVIIFSAGNEEESTDLHNVLRQSPQTIVVTATAVNDKPAWYTNFGESVDVAAPGGGRDDEFVLQPDWDILSLHPQAEGPDRSSVFEFLVTDDTHLYCEGQDCWNTEYRRWAGTSMAVPHVSGLAALLLSKYPYYSSEQVRQAIVKGSDDIESPGFDLYTGYGRINVPQSLEFENPIGLMIRKPNVVPWDIYKKDSIDILLEADRMERMDLYVYPLGEPENQMLIGSHVFQSGEEIHNPFEDLEWGHHFFKDGDYTMLIQAYASSQSGESIVYEDRQVFSIDNELGDLAPEIIYPVPGTVDAPTKIASSRIAFHWSPPKDILGATDYEYHLKVGTSPGRADVANIRTRSTSAVVRNIRSAVYVQLELAVGGEVYVRPSYYLGPNDDPVEFGGDQGEVRPLQFFMKEYDAERQIISPELNRDEGIFWGGWNGYVFTVLEDGVITQLGGMFDQATVGLWDADDYDRMDDAGLLAQVNVNAGFQWTYRDIEPVVVKAGQKYYVGADITLDTGMAWFPNGNPSLSEINQEGVKVEGGATTVFTDVYIDEGIIAGVPDIVFVPDSYVPVNSPPVAFANASPSNIVRDGDGDGYGEVLLDGIKSYDLDYPGGGAPLTYEWRKSGKGYLPPSKRVNRRVQLPVGTHYLKLIVRDEHGARGEARLQITIKASPTQ